MEGIMEATGTEEKHLFSVQYQAQLKGVLSLSVH